LLAPWSWPTIAPMGDDEADTEHDAAHSDALTVHERPGAPPERPSRMPMPGLGRYDLGDILGRGGMGEVVSARDEHIGRAVAIKRMRAEQPSSQSVARFLREARIQGQLEHPAIVPIHELSRDDQGMPYFVMKQLTGITLSDILRALAEGDPHFEDLFTRHRLLRAFAEVCLAVEFAHSRNILHRDLKPANIMLGDFGEVHVLDWGIARAINEAPERESAVDVVTGEEDATAVGMTLGTPGYMSPEQLRAEPDLDGRTDVYALGCILFEILALTPLHPRGAPTAQIERTPSLRAPDCNVPPELDAIVLGATAYDREDRLESARALGAAVQRYLDGDRDLALRKQLAGDELAAARAASERDDRPTAIQAAGRALALDPSNRDAADLVSRLMLEPPKQVPPEVKDALATVDLDALYASRKLISGGGLVFLAFVPLMAWVGFRDAWVVITATILAIATAACGLARRHNLIAVTRISLVAVVLAVGLVGRILSPFLVAPGLAAVTGMTFASHPRLARPWLLIAAFTTVVLGPVVLELAGILAPTTTIAGNTIVLHTAANMDPAGTMFALSTYTLMMIGLATAFGAALTRSRRAAQQAVELQSWQLGQLVPRVAQG